jgi:acyl dehydratase
MRYFEDIEVGDTRESAEDYELTAKEIVGFCSKWDPLPFHVDEQAAAATPVGKLFTSAVHSVAIAIRLGHQMQTEPTATVMGLGWDEVRFQAPACVGDRLRLRGEIIEARPSESKPGLGIIRSLLTLSNQRGETVISFKAAALLRRRPQQSEGR